MLQVQALFIALLFLLAPLASRAETTNCTSITSLPAIISTQGLYCLKQDLSTNISSGAAITITTNNVAIDCNDHKLGGLGAGTSTNTYGIYANNRLNIVIRNCSIRGFYEGVLLDGSGGGHLVENNLFDGNTFSGISIRGDNNMVKGNRVGNTGGRPNSNLSLGIDAVADILDNTVDGVSSTQAGGTVTGIMVPGGVGLEIRDNRVRNLIFTQSDAGSGGLTGIWCEADGCEISHNLVVGPFPTPNSRILGVVGSGISSTFCNDNAIYHFGVFDKNCTGTDRAL